MTARIPPSTRDSAPPAAQTLWDQQVATHGRMTNMKRTLAHSPVAFKALMEWYPLRDAVAVFLGDRLTTIYAHAVSSATDCLICSTFFRRILKDSGEDPDVLQLDPWELTVVEYGRQLARDGRFIKSDLFDELATRLTPPQLVELTVFGGMMLATNLFNNVIGVDLDDYLKPYARPGL